MHGVETPIRVEYNGSLPGANANVVLFNSVEAFPGPKGHTGKGALANYGFSVIQVTLAGDANADNLIELYYSNTSPTGNTSGSTFSATGWTLAEVSANTDLTSVNARLGFNIEGFAAICLVFNNGANAQTAFTATINLSYDKTLITSPLVV